MTQISATAAAAARPASRRAGSLPMMILGAGLALVMLAAVAAWFGSAIAAGPLESRSDSQPLAGVLRSTTHLQFGAGTLNVSALDAGANSLATMHYEGPMNLRPEPAYAVRDGVAELRYLSGRDGDGNWRGVPVIIHGDNAYMRLQLARDVQFALDLKFGAGDVDVDLTGLRVTDVQLQGGAGHSRIRLPESAGFSAVAITGGVGDVALEIPTGVAVDIHVSGGIGGREVDRTRFQSLGGGHYRSPDYATAANRAELRIDLGVGQLTVN